MAAKGLSGALDPAGFVRAIKALGVSKEIARHCFADMAVRRKIEHLTCANAFWNEYGDEEHGSDFLTAVRNSILKPSGGPSFKEDHMERDLAFRAVGSFNTVPVAHAKEVLRFHAVEAMMDGLGLGKVCEALKRRGVMVGMEDSARQRMVIDFAASWSDAAKVVTPEVGLEGKNAAGLVVDEPLPDTDENREAAVKAALKELRKRHWVPVFFTEDGHEITKCGRADWPRIYVSNGGVTIGSDAKPFGPIVGFIELDSAVDGNTTARAYYYQRRSGVMVAIETTTIPGAPLGDRLLKSRASIDELRNWLRRKS